jgi:hypothetical protein
VPEGVVLDEWREGWDRCEEVTGVLRKWLCDGCL